MQNEQLQQLDERYTQAGEMPQISMDPAVANSGVQDHHPAGYIRSDADTESFVRPEGADSVTVNGINPKAEIRNEVLKYRVKGNKVNSLPEVILDWFKGFNPFSKMSDSDIWEEMELTHRKAEQLEKELSARIPDAPVNTSPQNVNRTSQVGQNQPTVKRLSVKEGIAMPEHNTGAGFLHTQDAAPISPGNPDNGSIGANEDIGLVSQNTPQAYEGGERGTIVPFPDQTKQEGEMQNAA